VPVPVPAPPPLPEPCERVGGPGGAPILRGRQALGRDIQLSHRVGFFLRLLHFHLGRLRHGDGNFVLARHFRLPRRFLHPITAAATAAARSGLLQPDDVRVRLIGQHSRSRRVVGAVPNREEREPNHDEVVREGGQNRGTEALLLLLEQERNLDRVRTLEVDGQMPGRFVRADFWCLGFGHRECYGAR
jgi:hypothetical protein